MTIDELLHMGRERLRYSPTARLDADLLLEYVTALDRATLRAHGERQLPDTTIREYESVLTRRAAGEPVAYIVGRKAFWSLELQVGPGVLIPRPETELLVERALAHLPADQPADVLDVGTGSGAIALAIAAERPHAQVAATDLSAEALRWAETNARDLALRVQFLAGDLYEPVLGRRFDIIVSNPPYVAPDDPNLAPDVRQFEPAIALFAGDDGLTLLRRLIADAPQYLKPGGRLILEHGWRQGAAVRALLEERGFSHVRSHADLSGHERVTDAILTAV
jgi:release factor glutamine methyltransferase